MIPQFWLFMSITSCPLLPAPNQKKYYGLGSTSHWNESRVVSDPDLSSFENHRTLGSEMKESWSLKMNSKMPKPYEELETGLFGAKEKSREDWESAKWGKEPEQQNVEETMMEMQME
eukprot:bmy_13169T0